MSTDDPRSLHMSADDFRRHGHAMIDWIADYLDGGVEAFPVQSRATPGQVFESLPARAPESGEPFEAMMRDVESLVMPGITHWQNPNWFAFFPANTSYPSILGELLSAGMGVQGMLWATSPACTEVEMRVLDWLVHLLDLPEAFLSNGSGGGVIQDTASSATLCALLAARERATGWRANAHGLGGVDERLVAYCSDQTHSSMLKSARIAGFGDDGLRQIRSDDAFALDPAALAEAIAADRAAGRTPCFVCATVGTTSSNAIDPVRAIGELCAKEGIWLHVDGAMSGTAALCPEFRFIHDGIEHADSYCFNPHKWMFTNFDCDCFWVRDREALLRTLSVLPDYLRTRELESGAVTDYRDWHVPLGRRFRALKLWFVLRHYGAEGLRALVRFHVEMAKAFATWVDEDASFERLAPAPLNLVTFAHVDGDERTKAIVDACNASGALTLTHTTLHGRGAIRMSIGQARTGPEHVRAAWEAIRTAT